MKLVATLSLALSVAMVVAGSLAFAFGLGTSDVVRVSGFGPLDGLWEPSDYWFIPIPSIQAVHKSYWLAKQVSLSAMVFMLAAEVAGLATCPMEGFGERQVRRVLGIPSSHSVVLVVPVGYADNSAMKKTRLPLDGRVHRERW